MSCSGVVDREAVTAVFDALDAAVGGVPGWVDFATRERAEADLARLGSQFRPEQVAGLADRGILRHRGRPDHRATAARPLTRASKSSPVLEP
ncbi:MAG: DUF222 domain-containing protein [Mycobacterium sp.]